MTKSMEIRNITVPGPHGEVPLRIYTPQSPSGEALLWMHGGAFIKGDLDIPEADTVSRRLAEAGVTVASVAYRLAINGVLFPVPGDDVDAAWRWATAGSTLGIAPSHWHLGGGSAGANLAMAQALRARDTGLPAPSSIVLVYPVMHDVLPEPSAGLAKLLAGLPGTFRFTPELCRELNLGYVGQPELLQHPYAFPTHGDLEGMPPTLVVNAQIDDLRPSGEHFAGQLARAGVDVAVCCEPGTWHGYLNDFSQPAAGRTVSRIAAWIADRSREAAERRTG